MKPICLYHGSNCGTIKVLEPRISLEYKKLVYATDDIYYALVRAGKQLDLIREEYHGRYKNFELAECYPNAFKRMFECKGYLYVLNPEDFYQDPETLEYKSEKPVVPIERIDIQDIWYWMHRLGDRAYDFHYYGDDTYWETVRGGLNGFLERKKRNKQKMNEMIKAQG